MFLHALVRKYLTSIFLTLLYKLFMQTIPFVRERLQMRWMIVPMGIVKKLKRMSTKNSSDSTNKTLLLFLSTDAFKLMVAME